MAHFTAGRPVAVPVSLGLGSTRRVPRLAANLNSTEPPKGGWAPGLVGDASAEWRRTLPVACWLKERRGTGDVSGHQAGEQGRGAIAS
jgi:hypothetical protein